MPVYDDEKEKTFYKAGDHDDLGIHPERREAETDDLERQFNSPSADDPRDIKDAEEQAGAPTSTAADKAEKSRATSDDQVGSGYKHTESRLDRLRGKVTRNKLVSGGLIGLLVGGSFGLMTFLQGPFQFIHAMQLFQKAHHARHADFGDDRSTRFFRHALAGKAAQGRLGIISNHIANKYEVRLNERAGLRSVYNQSGRLIGYEVLDEKKAGKFIQDMEKDGIPHGRDPLGGVDIDGNPVTARNQIFVRLDQSRFSLRRSVTRTAMKSTGLSRMSTFVGKRLHIKRNGVKFHPLNFVRHRADDMLEKRRQSREDRDKHVKNGDADAPDSPNRRRRNETLDKLRNAGRTLRGPALAAAAICGLKAFDNALESQVIENNKQLIRMHMWLMSTGSQVMSGQDLDMGTLGEFSKDFYDPETGTSWLDDKGVQWETGRDMTGVDQVEDLRPKDGGAPEIISLIRHVPTSFKIPPRVGPTIDVCGILDSVSELPVVSQALGLMESSINGVLTALSLPTPDDLMDRAIEFFVGYGGDSEARGAKAGGQWNIGGHLESGDIFRSSGGVEISNAEALQHKAEIAAAEHSEFINSGLYDKYANIFDSRSASAQLLAAVPLSGGGVLTSLLDFGSIFNGLSGSLFGTYKAQAQSQQAYDYGIPYYGFTAADMSSDIAENPFDNYEKMLEEFDRRNAREEACHARDIECPQRYSSLEELNTGNEITDGHGGPHQEANGQACFGMGIKPNGDLIYGESPDYTEVPEACHQERSEIFLRYRFYIADLINAHSLACYEGDESSCTQLGFNGAGSSGADSGGTSTTINGLGFPLAGSKSTVRNPGIFQNGDTQSGGHGYIAYDIYADPGTQVVAFEEGVVTRNDHSTTCIGDAGVSVHNEATNTVVWYAHLRPDSVVAEGTRVSPGDPIGVLHAPPPGQGGCSTPHLHIDKGTGSVRGGCSRANPNRPTCPNISIGRELYTLYQALPE